MAKISPPIRVLVVDDDPLIRWALGETLRASGCEVLEARDRDSAMRALLSAAQPFDVILLDYWLPDCADLTLLAAIRGLAPDCQVVIMSAHATADVAEDALRLGACRVLYKPFEMSDVVPVVLQAHLHRPPQ
jgi:DNA-binding NtrC family response regulator